MTSKDLVILVDERDQEIGTEEKLKAHQQGQLHRAISVFIFNSKGEMLLQQRATTKYHSGGLWTNTCCSHPMPGESSELAAHRRLKEEMGLKIERLEYLFNFLYRVELDNDLTEHELDHVFIGRSDAIPVINKDEASNYMYLPVSEIRENIKSTPEQFTFWFGLIFERVAVDAKKKNYF